MTARLLILSFFALIPLTMKAQDTIPPKQNSVFVPIAKYIEQGDAECLSAWFAKNLEINVMGTSSNCSRNQARQILKNFFTDYTPKSFSIVYKSGNYPMRYAVGNLVGGGNVFSVTILVKMNDSGNYIEQLKIERK